jgi:hypothetical protein
MLKREEVMLDDTKIPRETEDVLAAPFSPQAVAVTGVTILAFLGRGWKGIERCRSAASSLWLDAGAKG